MTNISVPEQEPLPQDMYRNTTNAFSPRETDFPSRYWTFLYDNLKRSIEQIYQTCESDQNLLQCQVKNLILLIFFFFIELII